MARVLGIDLGTSNSCVAVVESGTPLVVPVDHGNYILPSVVAFKEDGSHLVGRLAKRQAVLNAERTVFAAKRLIGRLFDAAATVQACSAMPYPCVPGPQGDVRIAVGERTVAIAEVSALILAELRRAAEEHFEESITKAVITVPAYFNDHQRQATKDAGRIAGLEVLRIINEPTAAALAYGAIQKGNKRRMAVFDLGGGTFDVSVLVVGDDVVEVRSTAGDGFLGGRDFDDRILEWLLTCIEREYGTPLANNKNAVQRLREAAESAKVELSEKTDTRITLPFLAEKKGGGPLHVEWDLRRDQYERLVSDYVDRTIKIFTDTIANAGMHPHEIEEVILVGGMTRMPLIAQRVGQVIGRPPSSGVHPDLVVAVGAAIQGSLIEAQTPGTILLDVTPHNLGIMALGGLAETIIAKDAPVPAQAKRIFTTARDDQQSVRIVVFQGDSRRIEHNQVLGEFALEDIRKAPRGSVQIEVTFSLSEEGIVGVLATDLETGKAQTIEINDAPTLDDNELLRMIGDHQDQLLAMLEH